jgi:hypothetical protein
MKEAERKPAIFKSYIALFTDEEPQRLALFWHSLLNVYSYLGTRPKTVKEPRSKKEHLLSSAYDFRNEAEKTASRYGYSGKLLQMGDIAGFNELDDEQHVPADQFAFLAFFEAEKPLSAEEVTQVLQNYVLLHPNAVGCSNVHAPQLRTQAEIVESEDVYHRIVEEARNGIIFKKN